MDEKTERVRPGIDLKGVNASALNPALSKASSFDGKVMLDDNVSPERAIPALPLKKRKVLIFFHGDNDALRDEKDIGHMKRTNTSTSP